MLYWSESDPQFDAEPDLVVQLEREISDTEYEAKIGQLLHAAYQREVQTDRSIRNQYRQAYSLLKQADHYITVMIDRALARCLRPWWKFSLWQKEGDLGRQRRCFLPVVFYIRLKKRPANFTLKLSRPAFGPGLKPLRQLVFGGRQAACFLSRAANRGAHRRNRLAARLRHVGLGRAA